MRDPYPPEDYLDDAELLGITAAEWMTAHEGVELLLGLPKDFADEVPFGMLSDFHAWAGNDETRNFLRAIDDATGGRCTQMQFKLAVWPVFVRKVCVSGQPGQS